MMTGCFFYPIKISVEEIHHKPAFLLLKQNTIFADKDFIGPFLNLCSVRIFYFSRPHIYCSN